ncbi:hypothetical protein HO133_001257 [Letharia lupina]|uniref:Uncharacterized protein n=1 Tax=Letharia lupina TaxID=560253 RepID=A0A8H6FBL7_9LECA|nr:uncharacterized protein HO133_001257 [Letharia lupina]KAF6222171.1 hypothetical protein HO133_001257 [Letharia lupina]
MPHAPPAPPPVMRPGFPGMPGLVNDFGHVHLDPGHHLEHNMHQPAIQVIQPPGYGHMPDPRSFPSNGKPPVGYAGYIFTKNPVEHVGQKETWAIVHKEPMPASQADLKNQIEKHRKRGVTGLDQYMHSDMKGFKRKQIDELIRECVAMEPDPRFEYIIASIRRDTRRRQSGLETSNMQVILKRQPRTGIDMQGPVMGFGSVRLPLSGIVDLSGADDYEKSSQNSSNGHKPGAYPFERHAHHAHSYENAPSHDFGNTHAHSHDHPGNQHAHGLEQPLHPHQDHPPFHEEAHNTKHGQKEKAKKRKDKETKSPKIVVISKHESHKLHDHRSDSSSSSDSEASSGDTDRTPDTIISSEGSHYHHKDKKHHKGKHHRKSSSHDHEHEPVKMIYREHKRKEPTRRLASPPPSHRSRYRHEDVYVEPAFTSHRRPEPMYPRERPPYHHRAMSYDDERLHDHDMRGPGRRPTIYRRRITSTAQPVDPYEERAERRRHDMLDREIWEKEEAIRMRERARRDAARERMDSERTYHAPPRPRMDRMHGYHDDHLHGYHDDRY